MSESETMVERVARALHHLEAEPHAAATSYGDLWNWEDVMPAVRERHMRAARAAIEAMRDGFTVRMEEGMDALSAFSYQQQWSAAIDAALSEE